MSTAPDASNCALAFRALWSTCAAISIAALPADAQNLSWIRQLGSNAFESVYASAPDGAGGVFVAGNTNGNLGGPHAGVYDAWLARFDSAGNQTWIRQFGTSALDLLDGAAPDGSGGVYVTGTTDGDLGAQNSGQCDAWLARYDSAGNRKWIRQFGTTSCERTYAAAADGAGGVYLSGYTTGSLGGPNSGSYDAWLARYDGAGNSTWIRQLGSSGSDIAYSAAPAELGGVYVSGSTDGDLSGANAGLDDSWLARYDDAGTLIWIRQLGTSGFDVAHAVAPDGKGGVFMSGTTDGSLGGPSAGSFDGWLARYDSTGMQTWIRQIGTSLVDESRAAASDGSGGVYVCGSTRGNLGGPPIGLHDAWLARYDEAGSPIWIEQLGTSDYDMAFALAPETLGGVYVGGATLGSLAGPFAGSSDPWLALYDGGCQRTTYCMAKLNSLGCTPAIASLGTPRASSVSGFLVIGTSVLNDNPGLLLISTSGRNTAAFQGGILCVQTPIKRSPVVNSGGTPLPLNCSGWYEIDMNRYAAGGPIPALRTVGTTVNCQWWGRDPGFPAPNNTTLTDGLEYVVCP